MSKSSGYSYGWVVVAVGALMTCVAFGSMLSLAVFLQPISQDMGWSRSGVSAAVTIDFLAMGLAAFFWGALSDRFGTRIVVLAGSVLLGIGLVSASMAATLWQFQLLFGVLIGVAAGAFYAPMMAVASAWIEHQRSLAVSLVSAGMGVAPLTVAPFASWLITTYDWRTAMLVIGLFASALLIPAGRLADRIGRRRVFLTGLGVFLVGSTLCGFAPSVETLIAARVVQAVGAGERRAGQLQLDREGPQPVN